MCLLQYRVTTHLTCCNRHRHDVVMFGWMQWLQPSPWFIGVQGGALECVWRMCLAQAPHPTGQFVHRLCRGVTCVCSASVVTKATALARYTVQYSICCTTCAYIAAAYGCRVDVHHHLISPKYVDGFVVAHAGLPSCHAWLFSLTMQLQGQAAALRRQLVCSSIACFRKV